ncbi:hypothetical protein [Streptomyces sp. NPDC002587]
MSSERSRNLVTAEGGHGLEALPGGRTRVPSSTPSKATASADCSSASLSAARKDAPAFGRRIKAAAEASLRR